MASRRRRHRARLKPKGKRSKDHDSEERKVMFMSFSFLLKPVLVGCGIIFILILLFWTASATLQASPIFSITQVTVNGAGRLSVDKVVDLAGVQTGQNLFSVRLGDVRQAIETDPSIRQATVQRVLPGTLEISIDQRQPVAQIKAGRYYLIDAEGVVVPPILRSPDPSLPIIRGTGFSRRQARVGQPAVTQKITVLLALLKALDSANLPFDDQIESIDAHYLRDLSFQVAPGIKIRIGKTGFSERLELLNEVYEGIKDDLSRVKYIDLRFEDVVIGYR